MRRRRALEIPPSVCQSKVSAAWISPKGKIIPLPGGLTHGEWALKRQMKKGLYDDLYSFEDGTEKDQDSATNELLMEGWIRVSTWQNLEAWKPTPDSSRAAVGLVIGCLSSSPRIIDPEEVRIYVTIGRRDTNVSLAQFAKGFGGEDLLDKMYESLLARVAGEGHANQNGPTLYDQANPTDSRTHYQGELNDNPNNLAMPPGNTIMEEGRSDMNPSSTRVIPDSLQKIQASHRVAQRFLSARAKPVLVSSDDHTDYDNDPWELAREVGVRVLSNKDLRAMYVSGSEIVAALFDSSDSSGYEFDIAVSPSWQKFGLGSRLMDLAISLYEDNSEAYGEEYVLKADVISHVAEKMLRQRGFVEIGREPGHVIMTRLAYDMKMCNPLQISAAWIDPSGKLYKIPDADTHSSWAAREFPEAADYFNRKSALNHLLDQGWIRVVNFAAFEARRSVGQEALEKMAELLVDCAIGRRDVDPESEIYFNDDEMSIADFLERHGSKQDVERFYGALYSRAGASRSERLEDDWA